MIAEIAYIFVSEQVISLFSFVGAQESKRKFYSLWKSEYVVYSSSNQRTSRFAILL